MARCDCLNDCGDDPQVQDGRVAPCGRLAEVRRLAVVRSGIMVRVATFDATGAVLTVRYVVPLTPEQQAMVLPEVA